MTFRALQVTKSDDGEVSTKLRVDVTDAELADSAPDSDVTVDVEYSGINYKDGLALAGSPGVMRTNPLIPGIDLVGTVAESDSPDWNVGDPVILTGWGIGETRDGGLSERARVRGEWLIPLPPKISARRAAAIGTAGLTAALAVLALGGRGSFAGGSGMGVAGGGDRGEILVTGASGGVGSIAIALLAAAGHRVIASTGRASQRDYLLGLGAADTIERASLEDPGRPLQKQRWSGVIDSVGGHTLANAIAQTNHGGVVAACGLVGGTDIPTTVMPFILRGVTLAGINSVEASTPVRAAAWQLLERDLDLDLLDSFTASVPLDGAIDAGAAILRGELHGRTVVTLRE
ncbi:MAG: acrylyl-CoA reductase [Actinomycetota bacterium]|jgi:acrylyl-CoA reductase (NADPH)|nr:acrylyl-CoA reductase [Actinomycetota bacterium]MDQ1563313.1 acrylyl-CoA reductase [Actinomycetota bacterium]